MPTIFLAFANSDKNPLLTLRKEDRQVNHLLNDRKLRGDFIVHNNQFATSEQIINDLRQFKEELVTFLFSGHAGRDSLLLEDGTAEAEGIAALLGRCPNLKLVILNGCSTYGQVTTLLEKGIPIVIATSAPVDDERATQFSITFFEELAVQNNSIKDAFNAALAAAQVKGRINREIKRRDVILRSKLTTNKALWGLYYQETHTDLLDSWRLPKKPFVSKANEYIQAAIEGIYENYEQDLNSQGEATRKQDIILKRLPYSISEPIRKLLAPSDQSGQLFYDQPSSDRFRMLLYAYRSIIAFLVYVLVAQLWERKRNPTNTFSTSSLITFLKDWLSQDYNTQTKSSLLPLLKQLIDFFESNQLPFFLEELGDAMNKLSQSAEIKESFDFLEERITKNPQANLDDLCDVTEQHLAVILYQFGFLIHYGLTSIKGINVLFYQHNVKPNFKHKIVKLQQALTSLEDRTTIEENHHKTATILLQRLDSKSKYLYLSPFFIDENAYTNTPKAKLCAFISYDTGTKRFYFRHVSKPDDLITLENKPISPLARIKKGKIEEDNYYPLINGQFSAFCQAVLGETLDEL
ncbi:MAG: CHAT domain-containing protein [Bacteroidota bacterium]